MIIHLVLYSNGEPFDTTKQLSINSIHNFTKNNIIIHDYNLQKIMETEWFRDIEPLVHIDKKGKRDGYYNSWKPFIVRDVYKIMGEDDILYYVDSSQYFISGFTENIDKLCDIAKEKGGIFGSVGIDVKNNSYNCCHNIDVWNKIIPEKDNNIHLNKMHVLNSWFLLKKNAITDTFIDEWVYFCIYKDNYFTDLLITYHHTADQSVFNILVIKYDLTVFFSENITHDINKNKNIVLNTINNAANSNDFLVKLNLPQQIKYP